MCTCVYIILIIIPIDFLFLLHGCFLCEKKENNKQIIRQKIQLKIIVHNKYFLMFGFLKILLTGRNGLNEKKRIRKGEVMKREMDRFGTLTTGEKKRKTNEGTIRGAKWTGAQSTIHIKQ